MHSDEQSIGKCEDWWGRKHLTDIAYQNELLVGAGFSLAMLVPLFLDHISLDWFSVIAGDYNDDVFVLGIESDQVSRDLCITHETRGPVANASLGREIAEYVLTANLLSQLGCTEYDEVVDCALEHKARYGLHVHDDCFFSAGRVDVPMADCFLASILKQHATYLGRTVDWSSVQPTLLKYLVEKKHITIQSLPGVQALRVRSVPERPSILHWLKSKIHRDQLIIECQTGRAFLRPA